MAISIRSGQQSAFDSKDIRNHVRMYIICTALKLAFGHM